MVSCLMSGLVVLVDEAAESIATLDLAEGGRWF
jgi:hypothetical protein